MNSNQDHHQHPDHSGQIKRLNRIRGQLDGIKKMIEEHRYCPEILTQLRAVRSAVRSLEKKILQTHLEHCVVDAFESDNVVEKNRKITELLKIFAKYDHD